MEARVVHKEYTVYEPSPRLCRLGFLVSWWRGGCLKSVLFITTSSSSKITTWLIGNVLYIELSSEHEAHWTCL